MDKKKLVFCICVFFLLLFVSYFSFRFYSVRYPLIDTLQNTFFSENLVVSGNFGFENQFNTRYERIFGLRATFLSEEGWNLPATHVGYIFLLGSLDILDRNMKFFSSMIFFLLILIFSYKSSSLLFGKKTAFISVILLGALSSLIYWSTLFINDIPAFSFFVVSLFYFLKYQNEHNQKLLILSTFFLFMASFIRYSYLFFLIPFIIVFFFNKHKKLKNLILPGFLLFLLGFSLAFFHYNTYHTIFGPIGEYSTLDLLSPNNIQIDQNIEKPFFDFEVFHNVFKTYIFGGFAGLGILSLLSIFPIIHRKKTLQIKFLFISMITFLLMIFLYMGVEWSGYSEHFLMASMYTRYLLPLYFVLILLSAYSISYYQKFFDKKIAMFVLAIFFLYFFLFNLSVSTSQISNNLNIESQTKSLIDSVSNLPPNSIIFCNYYDKYIFPTRMTAVYATFPKEQRIEKTFDTVTSLINDGYSVYFFNEDNLKNYDIYTLREDYFPYFSKLGLEIKEEGKYLFEVK